jgi:hypothetical protein
MRIDVRRFVGAVCLLPALTVLDSLPARADLLYGLSSSSPGTVYTINTSTGAASAVVKLTGDSFTSLVDVSFLNGKLYASDVFGAPGNLDFGTIDLTTGAYTGINNQGGSVNWHALAANPSANLLYAVDLAGVGEDLVSVTPSGIITTIGATNKGIIDLAYDATDAILYGVDNADLYTIDTSTGATTTIGAFGVPGSGRLGLAFDGNNNSLYLNIATTGSGTLYSLNRSTGAATLIGSNGVTNGDGIDGLADFADINGASPVPEPASTLPLLLLGGLGFCLYRRRLSSLAR